MPCTLWTWSEAASQSNLPGKEYTGILHATRMIVKQVNLYATCTVQLHTASTAYYSNVLVAMSLVDMVRGRLTVQANFFGKEYTGILHATRMIVKQVHYFSQSAFIQ